MSLIEKLQKAAGMPEDHIAERAVKSLVARNFYTDGNLFIEKYDQLKNTSSMNNRNFRAKVVVDLAMSIECSLKCLVISLSEDEETPKEAYTAARGKNHKLDQLHNEVKNREKRENQIQEKNSEVFSKLSQLGVGSRYSYEIWLLRFNADSREAFLGEDLISETIDNEEWVTEVRNKAVRLNNLADTCHKEYLAKHSILSGDRFEAYDNALNAFLAEMR